MDHNLEEGQCPYRDGIEGRVLESGPIDTDVWCNAIAEWEQAADDIRDLECPKDTRLCHRYQRSQREAAEKDRDKWRGIAGDLAGHLGDEGHMASGSIDPECRRCKALKRYAAAVEVSEKWMSLLLR